jgi:hypothetical protein
MVRKSTFLFLIIYAFNSFAIDSLNINNTLLNVAYPNKFTNMSSMAINEQLEYFTDTINNTTTAVLRDTVLNLIKPLHLKVLRFPGGTIGNYYHFYSKGYGIDTSETTCANGRLESSYANQSLVFDSKADKNIIEYFKDEVNILKNNGDSIGVAYRLNSHTHFYKGDLIRFSDSIQYLIANYFSQDAIFLNTNGNLMDSAKVNSLANTLYQLQNDAVIKRMKKSLMSDSSFMYRFKENFDAIDFLKSNNINILGIEIGNETDAEYIIFDEDLSYLGYDCTNKPDSVQVNIFNLPMKAYLEGILKNWIVVSLYSDSIKTRYNIPIGVPAALRYNYLSINNDYKPVFNDPYELTAKRRDLWNKYFGLQPNIFAMIPHLYAQSFINCGAFANSDTLGLSKYRLNKIVEQFYKAYIDSVITFNLQNIKYYSSNKPLWVTEWNFTDGSYATNTFLHAIYDYYFIRKAMEIHEFSANYVQIWMYHFLVGAYHGWPLIRTGNNNQNQYFAEKQITYHPFHIWSNTMNQNVKRLKTPFWQNNNNKTIDAFINSSKNEIYIQYTNTDSTNQQLDLNALQLFNNTQELSIQKISRYILDAESFTSTNYSTCPAIYNHINDNEYAIFNDTLTNFDTLVLPGLSMGKFTLQLQNKVTTQIKNKKNTISAIYPNPTQNSLHVLMHDFNLNDNYTYTIYNSIGTFISDGKIEAIHSALDISKYTFGFYIIQIKKDSQVINNHTFIKL